MIGKKWLYLAGMIVFPLGSILCGAAQRVEMLIAFRVLQAIGAAMMMALGTAILTEVFPPSERGMVLGLGGLVISLGSISGPTIGGLILGVTTWHWIFDCTSIIRHLHLRDRRCKCALHRVKDVPPSMCRSASSVRSSSGALCRRRVRRADRNSILPER